MSEVETQKVELPDGNLIEIAGGDSHSGPGDCFSQQHVNSQAYFARVNGGPWMGTHERSAQRIRKKAETSKTLVGFVLDVSWWSLRANSQN